MRTNPPKAGRPARKPVRQDGRALRAEKSQKAIANALFELISEGRPIPTAQDIARRAGVSLRLVFHHYRNLDAIYHEVMNLQLEKVRHLVEWKIPREMPFDRRLSAFLDNRCELLETIIPMRRSAVARALESELLDEALKIARRFKGEQACIIFAPELAAFRGKERLLRSRALQAATSWNTWDTFRHTQDLSPKASREVMAVLIRSVLSPGSPASRA